MTSVLLPASSSHAWLSPSLSLQRPSSMLPHHAQHQLPEALRRASAPASAATPRATRGRPGRRPLLSLEVQQTAARCSPSPSTAANQLDAARPRAGDAPSSAPAPASSARPLAFLPAYRAPHNTFCSSSAVSRSSSASSSGSSASSRSRCSDSGFAEFGASADACPTPEGRPALLPKVRSNFDGEDEFDVASSWSDEMEGFASALPTTMSKSAPSPLASSSPSTPVAAIEAERPVSRAFAQRSHAIQAVPSPAASEEELRGRRGRAV